ncbi:MAG: methyltransferase domain-containing protein [Thermococci archaeon]|nr:methyltransferase domain-containing protein [Thermococci archaeon]
MGSVERLVRILDENVSAWVEFSFMYLMLFGFKHGIFKLAGTYTKREELERLLPKTNGTILNRALDAYAELGVMEERNGVIRISHPPTAPELPWDKLDVLFSDWVPILEGMYRMADYAFLSERHPRMILDFDKGADFWDMKLSQGINTLYRDIIVRITKLRDGMTVLDLGCGSVSPVEIGRHVGPNGMYVGVDFSVGLLSIAKERVKERGMDWVELKNMDVRNVIPSRKYDVVIMSFILEYFRDQEGMLRKGLKFLNDGGKLVVVDPFREEYEHIAAWEFFEGFTPEFAAFPSRKTVRTVAEEEGLNYKEFGKNIALLY